MYCFMSVVELFFLCVGTYLCYIRTNIAEVDHSGGSVGGVFGLHGGLK